MPEFHVQLGQRDAKAGRHLEPLSWDDFALADWREGHGPGWVTRPASPAKGMESSTKRDFIGSRGASSAVPVASAPARPAPDQRPYTPFSTPATKRRATSESGSSTKMSGRSRGVSKTCSHLFAQVAAAEAASTRAGVARAELERTANAALLDMLRENAAELDRARRERLSVADRIDTSKSRGEQLRMQSLQAELLDLNQVIARLQKTDDELRAQLFDPESI